MNAATKLPGELGPIHFIGIGGIGMSGIAEVMHNLGYQVQGSDISEGANVARLRELFAEGLARFGGPWLAGDAFTAVDAFFAPVAFRIRTYGLNQKSEQMFVRISSNLPIEQILADAKARAELNDWLRADPARMERIRRDNIAQSLRRHDWAHRWAEMLTVLGLPLTEAHRTRLARLNLLAAQMEPAPVWGGLHLVKGETA